MDESRIILLLVISTISTSEPLLKHILDVAYTIAALSRCWYVWTFLAILYYALLVMVLNKFPSLRVAMKARRVFDASILYAVNDAQSVNRAVGLYYGNGRIPRRTHQAILYSDTDLPHAFCLRAALAPVRRSRTVVVVVTRHLIEEFRTALGAVELYSDLLREILATRTESTPNDDFTPDFAVLAEETVEQWNLCTKLVIIGDTRLSDRDVQIIQLGMERFLGPRIEAAI